jgi:SWI/SNF-related matrix-associated actin-dependent regulator of chromatin subfamily A-like protein 1
MTLPLFPYQAYAADLMAGRDRYGLHDEMGIGKTATTIGAINRINGSRGLIVCPAMLRENWIKEWKRFSTYDLRVCKGKNIHDFIAWQRGRFDLLITSYEQATKWAPDIMRHGEVIDFLAMDEAHYLKNEDSKRARAILGDTVSGDHGIATWAENAWHITGTPMANDPLDVYTFLRFAKAIDMDSAQFVRIFFQRRLGKFGAKHTPKPEMVDTLRQLIYNNAIRRTHSDVGLELPPIFLTETLIEGDTVELNELLAGYPNIEQVIIDAIENGDISQLDAPYIATLRRLVGKAKMVPYAQMLKMELDASPRKRVVFCWHTEPLLYLQRYLNKYGYKCVIVYGDMTDHDRQESIRAFMDDPDAIVFAANIKVGGVGLTLVASCEIDMVESDWTPAGNAQAIKRVHRIGQEQTVQARFITLANSVDETVNAIVAEKTAAIAGIEGSAMTAAPPLTLR